MSTNGAPARREPEVRLTLDDRAGPVWRFGERAAATAVSASGLAEFLGGRRGILLVEGADLLKRPDLLDFLRDLGAIRESGLGICTGGEGLTTAAARSLGSAGVRRAVVPLCCGRQDANDWLMRRPGALKLAGLAIRALVEAKIPVTAEVMVTRPTMRQLAETVEVAARLGVRSVVLRRLAEADVDGVEFVPLAPRMELVAESLERAAAVALERRISLILRDFPLCVAPRLKPLFATADSEVWIGPNGDERIRSPRGAGCPTCPGDARCVGAPLDYVARFGWEEFGDEHGIEARVREGVAEQQALSPTAPMVFGWRSARRVRCDACAADRWSESGDRSSHESSRVIRARMVEASRYRPEVLRLIGADLLSHPEAAHLIYDAVRLFPAVEVAGEASPVVDWSDLDLRRIKPLRRFDAVLFGADATSHDAHCGIPGAFAATLRAIERLAEAGIAAAVYAVLHDGSSLREFEAAWADGTLPGPPRLRLSSQGGSLDELAEVADSLSPGPFRDAVRALLPRCGDGDVADTAAANTDRVRQQAIDCGRSVEYRPYGSDPEGAFDACREGERFCGIADCPGVAVGWRSTARTKWTVNT